jgi:hypothetical protein
LTNTEVEALYAATTEAAVAAKRQAERQAADEKGTTSRDSSAKGTRGTGSRGAPARTGTGASRSGVTGRATTPRGIAAASGRAPRPKTENTGFKAAGFSTSQKTGSVLSYDEPVAKEPPIKPRTKRSERNAQAAEGNATGGIKRSASTDGRRPMRSSKPKPAAGGDRRRGKKPQGGSGGAR